MSSADSLKNFGCRCTFVHLIPGELPAARVGEANAAGAAQMIWSAPCSPKISVARELISRGGGFLRERQLQWLITAVHNEYRCGAFHRDAAPPTPSAPPLGGAIRLG
jgi:hypothetical protein